MPTHSDPLLPALVPALAPASRDPENDPEVKSPGPRSRVRLGMAVSVVLIHVAALIGGALFFDWAAVAVAGVLVLVTTNLGISCGYHRLLVHRGYNCPRVIRYFFSLCGTLALQGGPLSWSATHRVHHQHTEDEADPHSPHNPKQSFWWGHMLWFFYSYPSVDNKKEYWARYVPDLLREPVLVFMERFFVLLNVLFAVALYAVGYFVEGWQFGAALVAWAFFVRIVFVWHATWLVNSAGHMWGYRNYNTPDQSRNVWWVAALTSGEGWHNNHHADPRSAAHGHKWWEIDPTYTFLRALSLVGLVWDIRKPAAHALAGKATAQNAPPPAAD